MTYHDELDDVTGLSRKIVVDSPDEKKQPTIEIRDKAGKVARKYHMPSHAHLMIDEGEQVFVGQVLAKIPRETTKTKDITGGLPRVVELFEARKPRETAVISEIDGTVKHGGIVKGQRKIMIVPEDGGEPREYSLPRGVHVNVQEGDRVRAGEPLMDGLLANSDDFVFDNQLLAQAVAFGYSIGEISCPTKYFPEASSIGFGRSVKYGLGVVAASLEFRAWRLGLRRSPRYEESPALRVLPDQRDVDASRS